MNMKKNGGAFGKPADKGSHKNGGFQNSLGFILACVGSAVGMGNIWLFPYRLGQYGGAAFLMPSAEEPEQEHLVPMNIAGKGEGRESWGMLWAGFLFWVLWGSPSVIR